MGRYSISYIASVITEDPDILTELDTTMDKPMGEISGPTFPTDKYIESDIVEPEKESPLSISDINRQSEVNGEPNEAIADQIKAQEEIRMQMDQERQQLVQPQMDKLTNTMNTLDTDIAQGLMGAQANNTAFSDLDRQANSINAILGQLQKQL